jgi:hypothetical protein
MTNRDCRSFEQDLSTLLSDFLGHASDQRSITDHADMPSVFTSCLKKTNALIFVDVESISGDEYVMELVIFAPDKAHLVSSKQELIEDVMKCFGLTKSKEVLVRSSSTVTLPRLRERLQGEPAISDVLFQQLKDDEERAILLELKKRGAVLERDFHELQIPTLPERITRVLDYFSGDEFRLVERKFAILCKDTQEIIFLLNSRDQIETASPLQCPKCARHIDAEILMPYYRITEELKELLDGNRWMPLLVRDSLIHAGVHPDDVLTEVKHREDEIDVLVFYRNRVLVIELKNRPVNLNDAYKLSAKTSRLENVVSKTERAWRRYPSVAGRRVGTWRRIPQEEVLLGQAPSEGSFTPSLLLRTK